MPFSRLRLLSMGLGVVACAAAGYCQQAPPARPAAAPPSAPVMGYLAVKEWPVQALGDRGYPSGPWNFIQVVSLTVEKNGNILVLHRGAYPILEYDPSGKFLGPFGDVSFSEGKVQQIPEADKTPAKTIYQAIYGPSGCTSCGAHSVRTDPEGNIWAIDAAGDIIYKMNSKGRTIMKLGQKGKPGEGPNNFYLPTDVAFAPNGDFYISDGYGNARVAKYTHDGKFILQFGTRGSGPGQFQLPHNILVDAEGKVYVTDRMNERVEVFTPDGKFLSEWDHIGMVSALAMTKDKLHIWTGGVLRDLDGKAVEGLPGNPGGHGSAVSDSGDVYLGQLDGKVLKFVKP